MKLYLICLACLGLCLCACRDQEEKSPNGSDIKFGEGYLRIKMNGVMTERRVEAALGIVDRSDSLYSLSITTNTYNDFFSIYMTRDYKQGRNRLKFLPLGSIITTSVDTTGYTLSYEPSGTRFTYTTVKTSLGRNDTLVFTRFDDRVLAGRVQFKAREVSRQAPDIEFTEGEFWIDLQKK